MKVEVYDIRCPKCNSASYAADEYDGDSKSIEAFMTCTDCGCTFYVELMAVEVRCEDED